MEDFMKGYFISFEGPDGSGKSTALEQILTQIGPHLKTQYLVTREPGGSKIAEKIRKLILDPANDQMIDQTEALLYAAARSQHVHEIILPALTNGKVVISDRYIDSSLAYQGAGRGLGIKEVKSINDFATEKLEPDLTLFFNLDPAVGLKRIDKERPDHEDRLEQEKLAFHQKVYAGYQELLKMYPERIVSIDASKSVEQVTADCIKVIRERLPQIFKD